MATQDVNDICERLRAVETWGARHDGRASAYWAQQHGWNGRTDLRLDELDRRLTSLEKRIVWFAGFAAGVGGVAGSAVAQALR